MALDPRAGYRPAPPRPPVERERPGWVTAAGWVGVAALCALIGLFIVRATQGASRRATEQAEVAREEEHKNRVLTWMADTSASAPVPENPPPPTSPRAKRMWVRSRMLKERKAWEDQVMERHGLRSYDAPAAWRTPRYWANAATYPEVGKYVEGRVAVMAEIERTSAAWMEARTAALARESGMAVQEIRDIFPRDFAAALLDDARLADVMLEVHRQLVRIDPRVHHAGGTQLRYEREDDYQRVDALIAKLNAAAADSRQAHSRRTATETAALARV
jgi:hypothetical protein